MGRGKVLNLKGRSFLSSRSESDGVSRLSDIDSFSMETTSKSQGPEAWRDLGEQIRWIFFFLPIGHGKHVIANIYIMGGSRASGGR